MTNRPTQGIRGAGPADAAAAAAASEAVDTQRQQLQELLAQPQVLAQIAARFGRTTFEQRQGHVFEWAHELSFNLDAIAKSADVRARVTTWLGQPHDPADLRLVHTDGSTVGEVQAKVVAGAAARLSRHVGIAHDKYAGMQLLAPSDHVEEADSLLTRRLAMPGGLLHERYEDVRGRLTDSVQHEGIQSTSLDSEELRGISADPKRYLDDLIGANQLRQLFLAGGAAAVVGATVTGVSQVASARVANGSFGAVPWTDIGVAAAAQAATSAAVAVGGQALSLGAQHAVADGATGVVEALAGSTLPFAIARGVYDVAVVAHGVATGRLAGDEAALAISESVLRTGAVYACAAIGQVVIPVPLVGALVGGTVGRYGAAMVVQGLRVALAGRAESRVWDEQYAQLLELTARTEATAQAQLAELSETAMHYDTAFAERVLPALERLNANHGFRSPDAVLTDLADITRAYGGRPIFTTMHRFDAFMNDPLSTLNLDLGGSRRNGSES